jgi:hypothetical protein
MKTRYSKPFETLQIKIPYETGMNPYSGLLELFEKKGLIVQQGNRLKYIDSHGKEFIEYRKQWSGELLNMVMEDYIHKKPEVVVDIIDEETGEILG